MKRIFSCLMILLMAFVSLYSCSTEVTTIEATSEFKKVESYKKIIRQIDDSVIKSINHSGYNVFKEIYKSNEDENLLFSQLSLTCALSMLENGASGKTSEEILDVLNIDDESNINSTYNALINYFRYRSENHSDNTGSRTNLNMSNSFWFRSFGLKVRDGYIDLIKAYYDGEIKAVDFADSKTKDEINQWIEDKTNGLLKNTIKKIDPENIAYLINTLYFKGQWIDEFPKRHTDKQDFNSSSGDIVIADMMHLNKDKPYFENEDCQIVALRYTGETMYVVLPKQNLNLFVESVDYNDLSTMIDQLEQEQVRLHFPKFEYNNTNMLNEILSSLGMPTSFDSSDADFSAMIEESEYNTFVSAIYQNTAIIVDEKGTEAAAVTVIEKSEESIEDPDDEYEFICDKPFLYIIRENQTNADLFVGVVNDPTN